MSMNKSKEQEQLFKLMNEKKTDYTSFWERIDLLQQKRSLSSGTIRKSFKIYDRNMTDKLAIKCSAHLVYRSTLQVHLILKNILSF